MSSPDNEADAWSLDSARELYHIRRWGGGYFDINEQGNVVERPRLDQGDEVELRRVIEEAVAASSIRPTRANASPRLA